MASNTKPAIGAPTDAVAYTFYLDQQHGALADDIPDDDDGIQEDDVPNHDDGIHADIFRSSVWACKDAVVSHVVVVETHRTLRTNATLEKDVFYTFEKGIANALLG